jgi:hypothetical protein
METLLIALACLVAVLAGERLFARRRSDRSSEELNKEFGERLRSLDGQGPFSKN